MTAREPLDLRGVLRAPVDRLLRRLPAGPTADRTRGGERWLVFDLEGLSIRARCETTEAEERVASWTATFEPPRGSLREAAERLGLWPELSPDARAEEAGPMLRRPLPTGGDGPVHSVTAAVRGGGIVQVTAFDEPPDWTGR